jgi:phage terminase large subunit GpA-like protein
VTGPRMLVKDRPAEYRTIEEMIVAASEAVRPPDRLTVSEAARQHVKIKEKNYSGPWSEEKTPYLVEPQEVLTSLDYQGMVFVGPARTGKSQMWLNWMSHSAICDPADMMLVQMSQGRAREFSLSDLRKHFRNSPDVRAKLVPGRVNDNVYDKTFVSGMRVTIVHPSINEFSGKTSGRNWAMDYDRLPTSIDGEGDAWTLLIKRAETLGRYGMTVVESSPGFDVTDAKWMATTPHEAPPCEGILSLFNMGDRRRRYWRCPQCHEAFMPEFRLFQWPDSADAHECAEQVTMVCPHDGFPMTPDMKNELEHGGRWLKEGELWLPDGSIAGTAKRSDIASFWLKGPSAAFNTWPKMVLSYLNALSDFDRTGSEEKLRAVTNTTNGEPYTPKSLEAGRLPEELKNRAQDWGGSAEAPVVPAEAAGGFLVATVDVQAGGRPSFVVHVFLVGIGGDIWHVDMFKIRKSQRMDADGERHLLNPATHPEDWDLIESEVMAKTYPIGDGSGRHMRIKIVACDSGGADGVTGNAYEFYRRLRGKGENKRFHLVKGSPSRTETAALRISYPDAQQKDRFAAARGDVPVWLVNSNNVKDAASNRLGRPEAGGMIHFPSWAEDWLYSQLTTEIRTEKGWVNPSRRRNEAFDLLAYCLAICDHPDIRIKFITWDNPPTWAGPWSANDLVFHPNPGGGAEEKAEPPKKLSLTDLAEQLN